ncbi:MAG: GTPase [Candidatus Thermoplasmatota archaeon]|nr:GTPase [Candidatus Thermoplasmatota archaeon]MEC7416381.1 GTPase [Candidatus Thermoplasmatota archaeon]MEC7697689.1 GTPase [Candidatus Thermoplasmatota archaeon]MEC8073955.1 GTPase [Candidatus Thermoplasmatota archaeon]MEC8216914.1 GTPase [Candidatus Thermoplasmatota archaeon]
MNLQEIKNIATSEELIDRALRRASKVEEKVRNPDYRARLTAVRKIHSVADNLANPMISYVKAFPSFDSIHPFDREIIDLTVGVDKLKKSLGAVDWARKEILMISTKYVPRARARKSAENTMKIMSEAYTKMTNVVRQISKSFDFLISARSIFRNLPNVDTESSIAVFAGAPNVGKSSLIGAISSGKPEVKSYPFTTKAVSLGHVKKKYSILQVMDTPGLLDRSDSERNDMEKQGIAAFDFLDPIIVFLTDLTGTSGYSLQMQTNLRDELKLRYPNCEWVDVLSKNDLDFEDELGIDSAIKVSAYKDEGVDRLKDQLLNLIP